MFFDKSGDRQKKIMWRILPIIITPIITKSIFVRYVSTSYISTTCFTERNQQQTDLVIFEDLLAIALQSINYQSF